MLCIYQHNMVVNTIRELPMPKGQPIQVQSCASEMLPTSNCKHRGESVDPFSEAERCHWLSAAFHWYQQHCVYPPEILHRYQDDTKNGPFLRGDIFPKPSFFVSILNFRG